MPASVRFLAVLLPSLVLGALTLSLDACGTDPTTGGAPPPLATGKPSVRDASIPETAPAMTDASPAPADAGAPARHFTGTLAASAVTGFGGSPYCKYTITLKQIDVDVTVNAAGGLAGASVTDLAVEANVQPCPNAPADPTVQKYTLASSLKLPTGGLHLELAPDPANHPSASLVLEGDFGGDHVMASLEWHRTDQQPPLDWRVTAGVPLDRH
jgi:hypothetical protein